MAEDIGAYVKFRLIVARGNKKCCLFVNFVVKLLRYEEIVPCEARQIIVEHAPNG